MSNFNWTGFNVGDYNLDHSEGYFTDSNRSQNKMEKVSRLDEDTEKENLSNNVKSSTVPLKIKTEPSNFCVKTDTVVKTDLLNKKVTSKPSDNLLKTAITRNIQKALHVKQHPPLAYRYVEIYENKKKNKITQMLEDEKKKRQFHSRPVPNFKQKSITSQMKIPVTIPITPQVLKKSKEVEEHRRQKLDEINNQNQQQKYYAREAKVLHEKPFVPKKITHYVQSQPFNLNVEKRLEERKQFDEICSQKMEEKKKKVEEEERLNEENLVKELRKLATFKARPNPFTK